MKILLFLALAAQSAAVDQIEKAVADGIRSGAFPGAVVVVGTSARVLHAEGYGHFTWSSTSAVPDPATTLYDLASLTKVVAATPAIMRLIDAGELSLDDPVQRYLPGFTGAGKETVTVRQLLEHRSGLRAFLPLHTETRAASEAKERVLVEALRWPPGSRVVYSDLNAMLLGWIVESVRGESLATVVESLVFGQLAMDRTGYQPAKSQREWMAPVGLWRGHVIAGELHDQNAVRLNGVSGHAGLYSTGLDLGRYAQAYLNNGRDTAGNVVFSDSILRVFTTRGGGNRALGWEMRDSTSDANTGRLLSDRAFGHGGYTGTSIWIDPAQDLFVIVLTNRVFAPKTRRSITKLKGVRAQVADAAVQLLGEECASVVIAVRRRSRC